MAVTIKHGSLTGAAANPNVLVDGPKWDADHTVTGLDEALALKLTAADNLSDVPDKAAARANLNAALLSGLSTGVDLNTLTTTGTYTVDPTSTNTPSSDHWYVDVQVHPTNATYCRQIARSAVLAQQQWWSRVKIAGVWGPWEVVPVAANVRGYLSGLTLSTAGASTTFSIAAGTAADALGGSTMTLASARAKTASAWALGAAAGSLDTGSIAASTWYHVYLIKRPDTGVVDALVSLSATAPTLPTNYTLFRRLGSMKTNGSSQWTAFIQDGDTFQWGGGAVGDVAANNPGTAAVLRTLSVPTGVSVTALIQVGFSTGVLTSNPASILISDPAVSDIAPTTANATVLNYGASSSATNNFYTATQCRTNTSAQVRSRLQLSDANISLNINTVGWIDRRGRD